MSPAGLTTRLWASHHSNKASETPLFLQHLHQNVCSLHLIDAGCELTPKSTLSFPGLGFFVDYMMTLTSAEVFEDLDH